MLTSEQVTSCWEKMGRGIDKYATFARAIEAEVRKEQADKIAELETLCDATYVTQGADAYNHACNRMAQHQKERAKACKEVGTEGSLCDGMEWLYRKLGDLERQLEEARKDSERIEAIEFYTREPDEWEIKYGRCKNGDTWCWTFYAPFGVQGDTRLIIDAAIKAKEQP